MGVRHRYAFIGCLFVVMLTWFPSSLQAGFTHNPALHWQSVESEHFRIYYHDGLEPIARDTLSLAEQIHKRLSKELNWTPESRTHVVLTDEYDFSNGMATPYPHNWIELFLSPPDGMNTLEDHAGWIETVLTHEYTHVLHLDKVRRTPAFIRKVAGRVIYLFPNAFQPRLFVEGLATWVETDDRRGIGRGQSALYDGMMRMEVVNGINSIRQVTQPLATWPGSTTAYLYGVHYHQFLEAKYGKDKIVELTDNYAGHLIPFALNFSSRRVFGKNYGDLWPEFNDYLKQKFEPQIQAIRKQGLVEGERLTQDGYRTGPIASLPNGRAYYVANDGKGRTGLWTLSPQGKTRRLRTVTTSTRLDVHPTAGLLLIQPRRCHNTGVYYDLFRANLRGRSLKRLTHCGRYRNATWSADGASLYAVSIKAGVARLVQMDATGKNELQLWQGAPWEIIGRLDASPDGQSLVASVWRSETGWNLERFDLAGKSWQRLTSDAAIDADPQYSPDGKAIVYVSDEGGVFNVRRRDVPSGKTITLTNLLGAGASPAVTAVGDVVYAGYTADGWDVYRLPRAQQRDAVMKRGADGPSGVPLKRAVTVNGGEPRPYSPLRSLRPRWWIPVASLSADEAAIGVVTGGTDILGEHGYALSTAGDPINNLFTWDISYFYDGWYPLIATDLLREHTTFRNTAGARRRVRRTDRIGVEAVFPVLGMYRGLTFNLGGFVHREEDAWLAAGEPGVPAYNDHVAGAGLVYDSTSRFPLSISRSGGRTLSLVYENSDVIAGSDYSGAVTVAEWREFLRLGGEHVLALHYAEGVASGAPRPFVLGGTTTANSDVSPILDPVNLSPFNHRDFGLRGYPAGLPQLTGPNMRLAGAEYRFPLMRFERGAMVPPVGVDKMHGALFYEAGAAWAVGASPTQYYRGAGLEFSTDVVLFYNLPLQVTLGYARGLDTGGQEQVYLRIGGSF